MARLPQPGADNDSWGDILNDFLLQTHTHSGELRTDAVSSDQLKNDTIIATHIKDEAITATKLDAATQITLAKADTSIQSINTKTPINGSVSLAFGDLTDVTTSTPTNGQTLIYNTTTHKWTNQTPEAIVEGTTDQYYRGDKSWQTLTKAAVGLGNVDNTNDLSKPISTAAQAALDSKLAYIAKPTGYIRVPGNPLFGTTDFYVMKYQAKNVGSIPTSQAAGTPWVSITQTSAIDTARSLGQGYHLITEAEWMTIAMDTLYIDSNWTGGVVGSGSLYSGHNDNSPTTTLDASTDDSNGYYGTGNTAPSNQRRTLTLSNGEVIWDLAGNVWEWTCAQIIGGDQPTATPGFNWRELTAITRWGALNYSLPTGRGWNSTQGLGKIFSDGTSTNTTLYGFIRGGCWNSVATAGAFGVLLSNTPSGTFTNVGFRVAKSIL